MKRYLRNPKLWYILGLLIVDVIFFTKTNTTKVPSFVLIVGLALLIATMYWIFRVALIVVGVYIAVIRRHQHRLALVLTLTSSILFALQSVEQLSIRDALVIVPLVVVLYIYLSFVKTRPIR